MKKIPFSTDVDFDTAEISGRIIPPVYMLASDKNVDGFIALRKHVNKIAKAGGRLRCTLIKIVPDEKSAEVGAGIVSQYRKFVSLHPPHPILSKYKPVVVEVSITKSTYEGFFK